MPIRRICKRGGLWTAIIAVLAWLCAPAVSLAISEYQLKAAFLLNFGKFIEWPDSETAGAGDPLTICVLGDDPFGKVLDRTVEGRTVGERPIEAKRILQIPEARECQVLFVSRSEEEHVPQILRNLGQEPVLIVGDMDGFARRGGAINFITVDNKIRFEINESAAERAGLKISSKLLKLATEIVKDDG